MSDTDEEIAYGWEDDPLGELLERCQAYVGQYFEAGSEDVEGFWDEAIRDIFRVGSSSHDLDVMRFHLRCVDELDLLIKHAEGQMMRLAADGVRRYRADDPPDPFSPERIAIHAITTRMTDEQKRMAEQGIEPPPPPEGEDSIHDIFDDLMRRAYVSAIFYVVNVRGGLMDLTGAFIPIADNEHAREAFEEDLRRLRE